MHLIYLQEDVFRKIHVISICDHYLILFVKRYVQWKRIEGPIKTSIKLYKEIKCRLIKCLFSLKISHKK